MHRHAVEYSTYPRGPRSGPGCSVPRRTQILLRNIPSLGAISRLYQRSRARRSATIIDRRSASVPAAYRVPRVRQLLPYRRGTPGRRTSRFAPSSIWGGHAVLASFAGRRQQRSAPQECISNRYNATMPAVQALPGSLATALFIVAFHSGFP